MDQFPNAEYLHVEHPKMELSTPKWSSTTQCGAQHPNSELNTPAWSSAPNLELWTPAWSSAPNWELSTQRGALDLSMDLSTQHGALDPHMELSTQRRAQHPTLSSSLPQDHLSRQLCRFLSPDLSSFIFQVIGQKNNNKKRPPKWPHLFTPLFLKFFSVSFCFSCQLFRLLGFS